ncbi:hypothetical protein JXQ70_01795 [bacterium]|nr:hypothetical protein [bacterium]
MGSSWETVIFKNDSAINFDRISAIGLNVAEFCINPIHVRMHFMISKKNDRNGLISTEITAFTKKKINIKKEAISEINKFIFRNADYSFHSPEVLLAKKISENELLNCLYLYFNDTYNAAGYIVFTNGNIEMYEIFGWEGSESYFTNILSKENPREMSTVFKNGIRCFNWDINPNYPDEIFDIFYSKDSICNSYLLIDKKKRINPPVAI